MIPFIIYLICLGFNSFGNLVISTLNQCSWKNSNTQKNKWVKKKKKRIHHRTCSIFAIHYYQIKKFAGKLFYNNHSVMAFPVLWVSVLIFLCYTNQTQTTGFSNNKKTTNIHVGILCMYNNIKKSSLSLTLSP